MNKLRQRLSETRPLILDGGLGTMLIARGLARGAAPEQWNLDQPDQLIQVHRLYVEAGSEAVHANTFGANPIRLHTFGLEEQCERINERAVELARRSGAQFVLADIGPTGEFLPPVGKADPAKWRQAFLRQGRALAATDVDGLHIETMTDAREATVAYEAMREVAPELPLFVSLTFDRKKRGFFTAMGDRLGASLVKFAQAGADAVGANCSITSVDMRDLVTAALADLADHQLTTPLVVQANAGQPRISPDGVVYDQQPEAFAQDAAAMITGGARLVGGCCGTDPRFIAQLAQRLAESST